MMKQHLTDTDVTELLRGHGIGPTSQRKAIACMLFAHGEHVSAEDVYLMVNRDVEGGNKVSKATVYNTLGLFAREGLVREVIADPAKIFYDPNTMPHHHFYDPERGQLIDIDANEIHIDRLPAMPEGTCMDGIDVVIRLSRPR
jgi:Fur family iron response transcriptional regulator